MLIFSSWGESTRGETTRGRNDQGRNDPGRNAAGAKSLGGELDLGRNDPDSGPPIPISGSLHDLIRIGLGLETQQTQSLGPSSKLPLDKGHHTVPNIVDTRHTVMP